MLNITKNVSLAWIFVQPIYRYHKYTSNSEVYVGEGGYLHLFEYTHERMKIIMRHIYLIKKRRKKFSKETRK